MNCITLDNLINMKINEFREQSTNVECIKWKYNSMLCSLPNVVSFWFSQFNVQNHHIFAVGNFNQKFRFIQLECISLAKLHRQNLHLIELRVTSRNMMTLNIKEILRIVQWIENNRCCVFVSSRNNRCCAIEANTLNKKASKKVIECLVFIGFYRIDITVDFGGSHQFYVRT